MNKDIIAKALEEEFEERVEQYSDCRKKHRFSLSYRIWERKMLYDLKRNKTSKSCMPKKIKAALCSFVAVAVLLAGGTVFASLNFGRYAFDTEPEYSKLFIENLSSDKTSFEEYYGLPEESGWKLVNYDIAVLSTMINYECEDKKVIFDQSIILKGNMGNIDTENAVIEPMSIYNENDGFFIEHQNGECSLYWIYDGYLLDLGGNIDKNEIVELAKLIQIVDF